MIEPLLTVEENLTIAVIRDTIDSIVDKQLAALSLCEDNISVLQLLADMLDLSVGEGSLRDVEEMIGEHFGAARAKTVKSDLVGIFTEIFNKMSNQQAALVRVALLQKLQDAIAAAPPGMLKVVDGNLLVRRRKL
jgi:hypothetical protein